MSEDSLQPLYTRQYFLITAVFFLLFFSWGIFFLLPIRISELGGGKFEIGLIMGAAQVSAVAARFLGGSRLDRLGRKKLLVGSAVVNTGVVLAFLAVRRVDWLPVVLRVIQGVAYGVYFTAVFTVISDLSPSGRMTEGLGNFGMAGLLALALAPWLGEKLIAVFGFNSIFFAAAAASLLAVFLAAASRESLPPEFCLTAPVPMKKSLAGGVGLLLFITVMFGSGRGVLVSFAADHLSGGRTVSAGVFLLIYSLTAGAVRFAAGPLADRRGKLRVLAPALAVFSLGVALAAALFSNTLIALAAALAGLGHGFLYPVLNALVIERSHDCARGTATGYYTGSYDVGVGLGAIFWGGIASFTGYPAMFVLAGVAVLAGVFAVRALARKSPPSPR